MNHSVGFGKSTFVLEFKQLGRFWDDTRQAAYTYIWLLRLFCQHFSSFILCCLYILYCIIYRFNLRLSNKLLPFIFLSVIDLVFTYKALTVFSRRKFFLPNYPCGLICDRTILPSAFLVFAS